MLDFDLAWPGGGPGEGVSGSLSRPWNGPLRHLGPFCACELMLPRVGAVALLLVWLVVVQSRVTSSAHPGPVQASIRGLRACRRFRGPRGQGVMYRAGVEWCNGEVDCLATGSVSSVWACLRCAVLGTRVAGSCPQLSPPPSESLVAPAGAKDVSAKPSSTTRHHQRDKTIKLSHFARLHSASEQRKQWTRPRA